MTYRSTGVRADGSDWVLDGELTLKGVTRTVPLKLEVNGFGKDPYGGTRAGFTATGHINRGDFGVTYNAAIEGGGVVVVRQGRAAPGDRGHSQGLVSTSTHHEGPWQAAGLHRGPSCVNELFR